MMLVLRHKMSIYRISYMVLIAVTCCISIKTIHGKELQFELEPLSANKKTRYIFVRDHNSQVQCKNNKRIKSEDEILQCKANQLANITWEACFVVSTDIDSIHNFPGCRKMFQSKYRKCQNKTMHNTANAFATTMKRLFGKGDWEPHRGCLRCVAQVGIERIETIRKYDYDDKCGTPTRYNAIGPSQLCLDKDETCEKTKKLCRVPTPHNVRVEQTMTDDGTKFDLVLQWEQEKTINNVVGVYGYKIEFIDEDGDHICKRLITKYNNTQWFKNGRYYYSVHEDLGTSFRKDFVYNFTIQALPTSKIVTKVGHFNRWDACENYKKKFGRTPTICIMVSDIRQGACDEDGTTWLTWNTTQLTSNVSMIQVYYEGETTNLLPNVTGIKLENHYQDVTYESDIYIRLKVGDIFTIRSKIKVFCGAPPEIGVATPAPPKRISSVLLFSMLLLSLILIILVAIALIIYSKKWKIKNTEFYKQLSMSSTGTISSNSNKTGSSLEVTKKSVMLVYPEGCVEVEKLVLRLSKLLSDQDITVHVDLLENERVCNEGISKKLSNDFENSTYVVVLVTKPSENEEIQKNYRFVIDALLLPASSDESQRKRFIGLYLAGADQTYVPPVLKQRVYDLSKELDYFLLHVVLDLQTNNSSGVCRNIIQKQWPDIDDEKSKLRKIINSIQENMHKNCYPSTCVKGNKENASKTPSLESIFTNENIPLNENQSNLSIDDSSDDTMVREPSRTEMYTKDTDELIVANC